MTTSGPRVGVVGLGAIGGSLALALRAREVTVVATAASADDRRVARSVGLGITDDVAGAVAGADIAVLAVPLDALPAAAADVLRAGTHAASIFHVGSLQRHEALGLDERVVGTHPLAGSAASGFGAARADAFRGATVLVESRASARQRADAELLWSLAGAARVDYLEAGVHDRWMAWASHLPQLAATALAGALAQGLPTGAPVGPGARDTTRLAASSLDVWLPILQRAPHDTVDALRALEAQVAELRGAIERGAWEALVPSWGAARAWRGTLEVG